jgi:negative regulator of flagellin synthesis FlgM
MDVRSVGAANGAVPVRPSAPAAESARPSTTQPISTDDRVEISPAARLMDAAARSSDVRAERLNQIKAEIEAGVYETPEKLEAALMRLFEEAGVRLEID